MSKCHDVFGMAICPILAMDTIRPLRQNYRIKFDMRHCQVVLPFWIRPSEGAGRQSTTNSAFSLIILSEFTWLNALNLI